MNSIQQQLNRRRPGQSSLTTGRNQQDSVECMSGLEGGTTLGGPLCFSVRNLDVKKKDYDRFADVPRPGHADITYLEKYGVKASSGGGRSSARQTIGRVIAGACAKQFLAHHNITFASWVHSVHQCFIPSDANASLIHSQITNQQVQSMGMVAQYDHGYVVSNTSFHPKSAQQINDRAIESKGDLIEQANVRCPHPQTAYRIYKTIKEIKKEQNSVGGIVQGCIYGMGRGLGEPVFDKLPALLSHGMLSIPATKGFEFGSGFAGTTSTGLHHNDTFSKDLSLNSNYSGGTLGGISSGETFYYKVAFKPVSTIGIGQTTCDYNGKEVLLEGKGRHDPCVVPRATAIVDNMAAMVVMDLWLTHRAFRNV